MTAVETPPRKTAAKRSTGRKATRRTTSPANGNGNSEAVDVPYEPPVDVTPPEEIKVELPKAHPVYGTKKLYSYQPKDASDPIVFPHISTCRPTALFFYDNRNLDEMHQAFAWMDLCEIPTSIGRRLFLLPDEEQATLLKEWFGGLRLTPSEVSPPGES